MAPIKFDTFLNAALMFAASCGKTSSLLIDPLRSGAALKPAGDHSKFTKVSDFANGGDAKARYGVMESGRIKASAIAKTPNSVSAPGPTFQRLDGSTR